MRFHAVTLSSTKLHKDFQALVDYNLVWPLVCGRYTLETISIISANKYLINLMSLSKIMVLDITCNLTISLNNKKATLTASCVLLLEMKCCILEYRSTTKRTILKSCRDKIHTQVLSRLLKDWQRRVQSGQVFYFLVLANRQTRHF